MTTLSKKNSKAIETANNEINANFSEVSNETLISDLSDMNIENLIKKTAKNRSIWKAEFKNKYSANEKTARRKIRNEQFSLSKQLLHAILTKQPETTLKEKANNLNKFYSEGLNDFSIYSNVSEVEQKEKFEIIHKAYSKMNLLLNKN